MTEADRDYVNGLDPYDAPSTYFGAGDEPFDGLFQNGDPVAAAFNNDDNSLIWGAGTWQAEISLFLVDANAGGDPHEQLAQQLLAFIFNVRHRLDDPGTIFWYGGVDYNAQDIIEDAVYIWGYGTPTEQNSMQELLNDFNESDSLPFIHYDPCLVCCP